MTRALLGLGEVGRLEQEWRRLAELRGNAFVTPEWIRCWHRHYGEDVELAFGVLEEPAGGLRGLLPLAFHTKGRPRTVRFAGANLADYVHPVCAPADEDETAVATGEALREESRDWSVLALEHVQEEGGGWVSALSEATGKRFRALRSDPVTLPLIDLEHYGSYEEYLAARSRRLRKETRRVVRRAERLHAVTLRRTQTREQLPEDMRTMFHLHDLRFGAGSSLRGDHVRSFHLDFAAAALERGWLRLAFLELDGSPVAAEYGWLIGGRYGFYNGGFDPSYAELSPGTLIRSKVIEGAFDDGASEFDLMLGDEPYKRRYADRDRSVRDHTLARKGHPATAAVLAEHGLRRVWRRLPYGVRRRVGITRRSILRGRIR